MAEEGSVFVDGVDAEVEDTDIETTTETNEEDVNNSGSSEEVSDSTPESTPDEQKGEEEKPLVEEKTEKGTRLDPDPLSRANQLRANAEAEMRQYHALLNDPERLEAYVSELKKEKGVAQPPQEEVTPVDPDKLETIDDLRNFAKYLQTNTQKEVSQLKQQLYGINQERVEEQTAKHIGSEIDRVRSKYPELRDTNSDGTLNPHYNKELDDLVSDMYEELDFNPQTRKFMGKISLERIADKIMRVRGLGEGEGSRKAQTDIIDKRRGRISGTRTITDSSQPDESKLSPSATIAERIRRASGRR
jgi:hypothetical protein